MKFWLWIWKNFFQKPSPQFPPRRAKIGPPRGKISPPPSWKQGKWHIKTTITQSTVGQFEPNFQWILRRHILISQCTYQDPTCPPRLQLLDLKDGWIPDGQKTWWRGIMTWNFHQMILGSCISDWQVEKYCQEPPCPPRLHLHSWRTGGFLMALEEA